MNYADALPYVAHYLDDALAVRTHADMPADRAVLVGYQCGAEPLFVAVWSYLPGCQVDASEAEEIASDYLAERQWFANPADIPAADYVLYPPAYIARMRPTRTI